MGNELNHPPNDQAENDSSEEEERPPAERERPRRPVGRPPRFRWRMRVRRRLFLYDYYYREKPRARYKGPPIIHHPPISKPLLVSDEDHQEFVTKLWSSDKPLLRSAMTRTSDKSSTFQDLEKMEIENEDEQEEEIELVVESILKKRRKQRVVKYLVKWENHPEGKMTWESEADLLKTNAQMIQNFKTEIKLKREKGEIYTPKKGPGRGWTRRRLAAKESYEKRRARIKAKTKDEDTKQEEQPKIPKSRLALLTQELALDSYPNSDNEDDSDDDDSDW